jgi:hypothetical protein
MKLVLCGLKNFPKKIIDWSLFGHLEIWSSSVLGSFLSEVGHIKKEKYYVDKFVDTVTDTCLITYIIWVIMHINVFIIPLILYSTSIIKLKYR